MTPAGTARREALRRARVYLIWTPEAARGDPLDAAARALRGGHIGLVQLRMKTAAQDERVETGRRLCALAREAGALFLVNDDVELARSLDADGVHVGQDDAAPEAARAALGADALIGLSTHDADEIRRAHDEPVDYVGLGPCYPTTSKALTYTPGGPALLEAALPAAGDLPVFPIGGILQEHVPALAAAGARAVAVGAAILAADDPAAAAEALHRALAPVP